MSNEFYVFEGVDGSGKSTLAKELCKSLNGVYYPTPPKILWGNVNYDAIKESIRNWPEKEQFSFFVGTNRTASEEIKKHLKEKNVAADRYLYSTLANFSVRLNEDLEIADYSKDLILPDVIVYVTAPWKDIEKRLNEGEKKGRQKRHKYETLEYLKKVAEQYERIFAGCSNIIKIYNTDGNLEEKVQLILKNLPKAE